MNNEIAIYGKLLHNVTTRVRTAQIKATLSANAEMIAMYFDIGAMIHAQQQEYGWGTKIIQKLSVDIKNELPKVKGFSHRNLKFMVHFFNEYETVFSIGKQSVSQLYPNIKQLVSQIPWGITYC